MPLNACLALISAVLWGGADFSGGMGVGAAGGKTLSALRVVLLSHASSLVVLAAIVMFRHEPMPHGVLLGWGLLAGVCAAISLTSFYIALSRGAMGASAAVSGLLAAAIPAVVSMVVEGAPTPLRVAGFVVAAVAIWLIAASPAPEGAAKEAAATEGAATEGRAKSTMPLAIVAGIGFGIYFTALRMANPLGIYMPMALSRVGSLLTCGPVFLLLVSRTRRENGDGLNARAASWALAAAGLDTVGNILFIAATRVGRLDIAAVLASLYPASTILLAVWILKERISRLQLFGMTIALAAVLMITL